MNAPDDQADAIAAERAAMARLQQMEAEGAQIRLAVGPWTGWVLLDGLQRMAAAPEFAPDQRRAILRIAEQLEDAIAKGTAQDIVLRMIPPN